MELNNLGKKIGILTSEEINQETQRLLTLPKEGFDLTVPPKTSAYNRTFMSTSYDAYPKRNPPGTSNTRVQTGYAPKSSRFNETRQAMSSRGRTKSAKKTSKSQNHTHEKCILCDHETDRELWVNIQRFDLFIQKLICFTRFEAFENSHSNIKYGINARSAIVARLGFTSAYIFIHFYISNS